MKNVAHTHTLADGTHTGTEKAGEGYRWCALSTHSVARVIGKISCDWAAGLTADRGVILRFTPVQFIHDRETKEPRQETCSKCATLFASTSEKGTISLQFSAFL